MRCPFCAEEIEGPHDQDIENDLIVCLTCLNPLMVQRDIHEDPGHWTAERLPGHQDSRERMAPGSIMQGIMHDLAAEMDNLPVLPEVPQRVMALVHDPLASLSEIAEVIGQDTTMTLRVLAVSNSAMYSSVHEIKDIQTACTRLGLRTVANIAMAVGTASMYRAPNQRTAETTRRLWHHSIATAYSSQQFERLVEDEFRSSLFLAGLFHDIGKPVLLDHITATHKGRRGRLREDHELLIRVLDDYHLLAGLLVAQHWHLPAEVRAVILCHDNTDRVPRETWVRITHSVALASAFAHMMGHGVGERNEPLADSSSPAILGLDAVELENLFDVAREQTDAVIGALPAP